MHRKRSLFAAFSVGILDNFGFSLVFILFAPLILDPAYGMLSAEASLGERNLLLGLLLSAFPTLLFLGAPLWGDFADRFGRKKALYFTVLGTAFCHFLSAIAIYLQNYGFLVVSRAVAGFFAGNISICLAAISDLSSDEKTRAHNYGVWSFLLGVTWVMAMVLGGYLSDPHLFSFFNPSFPFALTALLSILGFLIVYFYFTETYAPKNVVHFSLIKAFHQISSALGIKEIRPYLFMIFFWGLGWNLSLQWFTAISIEKFQIEQSLISFFLIILGLVWMLGGSVINATVVKKYSSRHVALFCTLFTAVCVFLSHLAPSYLLFSLFYWIAAITAPSSLSSNINLVSFAAPPEVQGKIMGFTQSFQSVASLLIPFWGAWLARTNIAAIFPFSALFLFVSFCILLLNKKFKR